MDCFFFFCKRSFFIYVFQKKLLYVGSGNLFSLINWDKSEVEGVFSDNSCTNNNNSQYKIIISLESLQHNNFHFIKY